VLTWAAAGLDQPSEEVPSSEEVEDLDIDDVPLGSLDVTLAGALLNRTLASENVESLLESAAALVWPRFQRHEHPTLPVVLDDVESRDPESARQKRRLLAEALVRFRASRGAFDGADAFTLIRDWSGNMRLALDDGEDRSQARSTLLDLNDFTWALNRARELEAANDRAAARGMAEVAALLFDRSDVAAIEVASQQEGSVNWETLASYFDAIPIHGEAAHRLRRWQQLERRSVTDEDPADAALRRDDLVRLFDRVSAGEVAEFWRLAWNLQFRPGRARGRRRRDDQLLSFPGVSILGADAPTRLTQAARAFLLSEHDHADEWAGTDRYDQRAWAGYLALVLLDDFGRLDAIPPTRLASWTGAVLWFPSVPVDTGDRGRKTSMLNRVAAADPALLASLIVKFVRGELRRGSLASEIGLVDPSVHPAVMAAWLELLRELTGALLAPPATSPPMSHASDAPLRSFEDGDPRTHAMWVWVSLLENLARADAAVAENFVVNLMPDARDDRARSLAAAAVEVLVDIIPDSWRRLFPLVSTDPDLSRSVAGALTSGHPEVRLTVSLDEDELSDAYIWLASLFSPEDDRERNGAHWVTPEEQARRVRDGVLTTIANRGTEASVRVLAQLHEQFPLRPELFSNLIRARIALFATAWIPPSPEEVQALMADARRRFVRSSGELGVLLEELLAEIGEEMVRAGEFLWDRLPPVTGEGKQKWWPKPEAALASFLAHDLELRLSGQGLAVHREVLVRATNPYGAGDKPDVIVEANVPADALSFITPGRFRVVIEVKCPWNDSILSDQRHQLADRYLPEAQTDTGLFVVGWYPLELWSPGDYRLGKLKARTRAELERVLWAQAAELSAAGASVKTVILTVPHPASGGLSSRL
ncbi:MAG: hypothetical protein LC808_03990, partial [Actinobacteria bacterium]|nr:hypothetical protein [Actinomycetota bacterium]